MLILNFQKYGIPEFQAKKIKIENIYTNFYFASERDRLHSYF